jgi:hypothetical protein
MNSIFRLSMAAILMVSLSGSMMFYKGCPGGRLGGDPFTALIYGNGPYDSPGVFNVFRAGGTAIVSCCFSEEFSDRQAERGGSFCDDDFTAAECDMYGGDIVGDCHECWDRYDDRLPAEGTVTVSGLEASELSFTVDRWNHGMAYYHPEGYTVVGVTHPEWTHTLQIVIPAAQGGEYVVRGADGRTVEPTVILRDESGAYYGTLTGTGRDLGKVVIDGDYPQVGETMSVRFSAILGAEDGRTVEVTGDLVVPFRTMPTWGAAS